MIHRLERRSFADRLCVTRQLVGAHRFRDLMFAEQALEEALGGFGVPVALKQHIQHDPVLVHSAPQPVGNATDEHVHFVQMPPQASAGFAMAQPLSELVTSVNAAGADGFSRDLDAAFEQQLLDIAVTQRVSVLQPDGVSDDRAWESITGQLLVGQHEGTLPRTTCQNPPR
jgi:hypothetical protein